MKSVIFFICLLFPAVWAYSGTNAANSPGTNTASVSLLAAGDIFPSPSLIYGGMLPDGSRDYSPYYEYVKSYIESADIATAWFGGPVAGKGEVFTGYPNYNNPPEYITAARDAGFDILLHTNHLLDQGTNGFLRTIRFFRKIGVPYLGVYDNLEDSKKIFMIEKNGIKIAFLSYLFAVNSGQPPEKWMINLIKEKKIKSDIEKAKEGKADFIIVALHWGIEYMRAPDPSQAELAKRIAAYGADMILGSHPHVIQPADMIMTPRPDGTVRKTFIIYSFGNYLCTQRGRYADCGVMVRYRIDKDLTTGITTLGPISHVPVWVLWRQNPKTSLYDSRILPTWSAMQAYTNGNPLNLSTNDYTAMKTSWDDTIRLLDKPEIGFVHEND